jgi:hypothetical protein
MIPTNSIFLLPDTPCPPDRCSVGFALHECAHRAGIVYATTLTITSDPSDPNLVKDHRAQLAKLIELRTEYLAMFGGRIDPRQLEYINEVIKNKQDLLAKCDAAIAHALAYWTVCKEACNAHEMTCTATSCAR